MLAAGSSRRASAGLVDRRDRHRQESFGMFPPGIRGAALSKTAWGRHPSRATKARLVTRSTRAFSSAEWAKNANAAR